MNRPPNPVTTDGSKVVTLTCPTDPPAAEGLVADVTPGDPVAEAPDPPVPVEAPTPDDDPVVAGPVVVPAGAVDDEEAVLVGKVGRVQVRGHGAFTRGAAEVAPAAVVGVDSTARRAAFELPVAFVLVVFVLTGGVEVAASAAVPVAALATDTGNPPARANPDPTATAADPAAGAFTTTAGFFVPTTGFGRGLAATFTAPGPATFTPPDGVGIPAPAAAATAVTGRLTPVTVTAAAKHIASNPTRRPPRKPDKSPRMDTVMRPRSGPGIHDRTT